MATKEKEQGKEQEPVVQPKLSSKDQKIQDLRDNALDAGAIMALLHRAHEEANLTDREQFVLAALSVVTGGSTKAQVAESIGKNQWQVYNIRRDAVRKIAKLLGLEDEEDVFPMLGLVRGHKLPERHTRYFPKKIEVEASHDPEADVGAEEEYEDEDEDVYDEEDEDEDQD